MSEVLSASRSREQRFLGAFTASRILEPPPDRLSFSLSRGKNRVEQPETVEGVVVRGVEDRER